MKATKQPDPRWRNLPTDDAVLGVLADEDGEMTKRDLARKLGHRYDFSSALARLKRTNKIEIISKDHPGRRASAYVRLIGAAAASAGVGFVHVRRET